MNLQGLLTTVPVSERQILTSLSYDPLTTRVPSDEKATEVTRLECPVTGHFGFKTTSTSPGKRFFFVQMQPSLQL